MKSFLYETHTHTMEASKCAKWTAVESVKEHMEFGYAGMILTNHFYYGNTSVPKSLSWTDWVHEFCAPYHLAVKAAKGSEFDVFFGWESCYMGTEFLIYGPDEEWLIRHPEIKDATIPEQYELIHMAGGLIIHPHPYREEDYIPEIRLYPDYIDGVEAYNACHVGTRSTAHYNPEFDVKAREYAAKYNFPMTAGSDSHYTPVLGGGMVFDHRLTDIQDFIECVKNRSCVRFEDGSKL